jgi:lysozyme
MEEFQKLLDKAGVKFFTARELFFRGASDARLGLNTDPPKRLWPHLLAVAKVADQAREILGKPVRIVSAYRSPAYNRAIKGASLSTHQQAQALDLQTKNTAGLYLILMELRRAGVFSGGLGLYPTFVHVDVRGYPATWRG